MNERVFQMKLSDVYPLYLNKVTKKGRTTEELEAVICWLTGYDGDGLREQSDQECTLERFFAEAPKINPNAAKITGVICGVRVEEMANPLMQKIRWMDKLVDELAKGKSLDKICRS